MDGLLAGTGTELQPGVGGGGEHPTPAAMVSDDGALHVAGEAPAGTAEAAQAPAGDGFDAPDEAHAQTPEARARLLAVHEPDQITTARPDLGTD